MKENYLIHLTSGKNELCEEANNPKARIGELQKFKKVDKYLIYLIKQFEKELNNLKK